jgi:inosose dehydratase
MSTGPSKLAADQVWLGITPTLWWNDDFLNIDAGIPFEQCISEMSLAGFVGCSIGHKYPTDVATLKAALDLRGLRISEPWVSTYFTIDAGRKPTIAKVHEQLELLDRLEPPGDQDPRRADLVVAEFGHAVNPLPLPLFPNCPEFSDHQWDLLIDGLHAIGRIARDKGRKLCYHPHLGTGVMQARDVDRLMDNSDPGLLHLLLDTAHLQAAGADPLAVATKYKDRIKHVHLKDYRATILERMHAQNLSFQEGIEAGIFTVPGDGSITTFPQILDVLAEAHFTGWLVVEAEQDPRKATPLKYAKMAYAYLRKTLG